MSNEAANTLIEILDRLAAIGRAARLAASQQPQSASNLADDTSWSGLEKVNAASEPDAGAK